MAPRGRSRKKDTRMDAALDAMGPYGFDDHVVKKVLKDLLKTYDNNWVFIEDNSYRLLIDLILEQQEQNNEENTPSSSKTDAKEENNIPTIGAGPSSRNTEGDDASKLGLPANATSVPDASRVTSAAEETCPLQAENEGRVWKDITLDESHSKINSSIPRINEENSAAKQKGVPSVPPGFATPSYAIQYAAKPKNEVHKPCYGWISDDEDEPAFVDLEPVPLPESLLKLLKETENQRNRKSRWDVKP